MFYLITELVNQKELETEEIDPRSLKFTHKIDPTNDKLKLSTITIGMETWPISDYSETTNFVENHSFGVYHISLTSQQRKYTVSMKLIHVPDLD